VVILGLRPLDVAAGDELDPLVLLEAAETAGRGGAAPLADGSGQVVEGPGSGLGVAGSGMVSFPWDVGCDEEWRAGRR
jgi:hypothetical protein